MDSRYAVRAKTEPNLAEWDDGDYEGLRTAEIHESHPQWSLWEDGSPRGEMPADVGVRADQLIARLHGLTGRVALFLQAILDAYWRPGGSGFRWFKDSTLP